MLSGDDVSIFFNYDSFAKYKSTIYGDATIDTTDADVRLNTILPFRKELKCSNATLLAM